MAERSDSRLLARMRHDNLSVARTLLADGKERHLIVRLEPVNGGLAYEYHDPVTNEVVGCVGRNRVAEFVTPLTEWTER